MTALRNSVTIGVVFVFATIGCYRMYTQICFLPLEQLATATARESLASEIYAAIKPLGFRPTYSDEMRRLFAKPVDRTGSSAVQGSDCEVTVAVELEWDPSITISDRDHREETAFVAEVKRAIQKRLTERLGLRDLEFRRISDITA